MQFEWHEEKAEANLRNHGVSFDLAKTVFKDTFAVEWLDDREDYGEERFVIIAPRKARSCFMWHTRSAASASESSQLAG